jgi:hypothetical protein
MGSMSRSRLIGSLLKVTRRDVPEVMCGEYGGGGGDEALVDESHECLGARGFVLIVSCSLRQDSTWKNFERGNSESGQESAGTSRLGWCARV